MSGGAYEINGSKEHEAIADVERIKPPKDLFAAMNAEQDRRDAKRERLIRKLQRLHDIESGLIDTIGSYWAGADDE